MISLFRLSAFAALSISGALAEEGRWASIFNGKDLDGWTPKIQGLALGADPKTMGKNQDFPCSPESQPLGAGNGVKTTGNLRTPGTFVTVGGKENKAHCINSTAPTKPVREGGKAEAEVHGGKLVKHLINGKIAFEYTDTKLSPGEGDAKALIEALGTNEPTEGYISLQSESHPYVFRNIEVLELKP